MNSLVDNIICYSLDRICSYNSFADMAITYFRNVSQLVRPLRPFSFKKSFKKLCKYRLV